MKSFIPFSIGDRKIEVLLQKIGQSPVKTLTELITNSDDSYKRLLFCEGCQKHFPEREYREKACPGCGSDLTRAQGDIIIVYNIPERKFQVIDHAEGLTGDEMEEKFNEFGEDIPGRTAQTLERGLFKQGLAQVLFTQEYGNVRSIKNGKSYVCKYIKQRIKGSSKKKRGFNISTGPKVTEQLRKAWHIPKGNGTLVEFKLNKITRKPKPDKLYEKLCNFFMLRKLLSDPNRNVKFIVFPSDKKPLEQRLISNEPKSGTLLTKFSASLEYEQYPPINITGALYENPTPLVQWEKGIEEREGGLLVFDDKDRVYDLTLLKFDKWQECRNLYGNVKLDGAYEIIKDRLDNHFEEVVLESRDGFSTKSNFYKKLSDLVEEHIEPTIVKLRKEKKIDKESLTAESKERQAKAFRLLNKLYKDLTENIVVVGPEGEKDRRPKNGIEFVRQSIKATLGKKYSIQLRVDTTVIPVGSTVIIKSENSHIKVNPKDFIVDSDDNEVIAKSILIVGEKDKEVGTISAEAGKRKAELMVEVIKEEIHKPQGTMEFYPDYYYFFGGRKSYLNLFVDSSQIPIGNEIQFDINNPNFILDLKRIKLENDHIIEKDIAKIKVPVTGHGIDQVGKIEATCFNLTVPATIKIISKRPTPPPKHGGKFSGEWRYEELARDIRTEYDAANGDILINKNHPVNKKYFGRSAKKSFEKYTHCQIYLAELILDECLNVAVVEAYYRGKLPTRLDAATDIKNYIEEHRFNMGIDIHKYFVKPDLLKKAVQDILL